jgi:hypothetical protein
MSVGLGPAVFVVRWMICSHPSSLFVIVDCIDESRPGEWEVRAPAKRCHRPKASSLPISFVLVLNKMVLVLVIESLTQSSTNRNIIGSWFSMPRNVGKVGAEGRRREVMHRTTPDRNASFFVSSDRGRSQRMHRKGASITSQVVCTSC